MEIILHREKETPGTWRYMETKAIRPLAIYLTKEQVRELGDPKSIRVDIRAYQPLPSDKPATTAAATAPAAIKPEVKRESEKQMFARVEAEARHEEMLKIQACKNQSPLMAGWAPV